MSLPPWCWDHRPVPPCYVYVVLGTELRASDRLGKHSVAGATSHLCFTILSFSKIEVSPRCPTRSNLSVWPRPRWDIHAFNTGLTMVVRSPFQKDLASFPFVFQTVYSMAPFPFPQLAELREKYTYNITPFPATIKPASVPG